MSDYIPHDNLILILQYLPVQSLLRFRCVSKQWKQLIDSPSFTQQHLSLQTPKILIDYQEPDHFLVLDPRSPSSSSLRPLDTPIEDEDQRFHLIGTLHGVVCLHDNDTYVALWNPSTGDFLTITIPDFIEFDFVDYEIGNYSGFWNNPSTKEYKVIIFKLMYGEDAPQNGVLYSSVRRNWTAVPLEGIGNCKHQDEYPPVVINTVAYWSSHWEYTYDFEEAAETISIDIVLVYFDFENEMFGFIAAPSVTDGRRSNPVLYNWRGELSLAYYGMESSNRCEIYLMQDDSWVNVFSFDLEGIERGCVLWVMGETEEVKENCKILGSVRDVLVMCDTKGGCVPLKSEIKYGSSFFVGYDFVETLVFP